MNRNAAVRSVLAGGFVAALLLACTESSTDSPRIAATTIERADALRLARAAATREGIAFRDYKSPELRLVANADSHVWVVTYWGRTNVPGNYFVVFVDAQTGTTIFEPGQ
jgi:hypothetical protein